MQERGEVHRLFHQEGRSKAEIADRLGMSRTTVWCCADARVREGTRSGPSAASP